MTIAEDKIRVIEKVLETEDTFLLREISSLLSIPSLTDYSSSPMSLDTFYAKIDQAEIAYQAGEVTDHEAVKQKIATWRNK